MPIISLDHWFLVQGYNPGAARGKRCLGPGVCGRGTEPSSPLQGTTLLHRYVVTYRKLPHVFLTGE